jgi:Transglutaminase-like superfamily
MKAKTQKGVFWYPIPISNLSKIFYHFPNYCLCRHQSVIALILLDLYHIDFKTFIGIRKEAELVGHAWTMVGTVFIFGTCESETYTIVATYS